MIPPDESKVVDIHETKLDALLFRKSFKVVEFNVLCVR